MRSGFAGVTVISATLLAVTACSDSANPAGPAPTTGVLTPATSTPGGPASAARGDGGIRVGVSETEYSITLTRTNFAPGTYTFVVDNMGQAGHDLAIKGPGVDVTKRLPVGSQAEVVVTLQQGTYELSCSIGNHHTRGMRQTLTVA